MGVAVRVTVGIAGVTVAGAGVLLGVAVLVGVGFPAVGVFITSGNWAVAPHAKEARARIIRNLLIVILHNRGVI